MSGPSSRGWGGEFARPDGTVDSDRAVRLYWSSRDLMPAVSLLGVVGLVAAVAMAVFGLPPVDLHSPLHHIGIMDPLCGGTRAARLTAQGHLAAAWRYNPLGILAVVGAGVAVMRLVARMIGHRWLNADIVWTSRRRRVALTVLIMAVVLLEIRQQGRADLLMRTY